MEGKYKAGDYVILHKPRVNEYPGWNNAMDKLDGACVKVTKYSGSCFYAEGTYWAFNEDWATPFEYIEDSKDISFF